MMNSTGTTRRTFLQTSLMTAAALAAAGAKDGEKLRVAVIGHTGMGDYGHGLDRMWLEVPGVEIVGVADAGGLQKAAANLPGVKGFKDYREMLAEVKPDIVSVAPRHMAEHHAMTMASIAAGAKGIYIEKPFCPTLREAEEIVKAADAKGVKIAVAHRNRFHPVLPVVKTLVEEEKIGRLLEIRARGKEDHRGGMLDLWVLGSHVLDLAVYFTGDPVSCTATVLQDGKPVVKADVAEGKEGSGPSAGNEVHARYETASGVPVFFDSIANTGTKEGAFGLQLIGTKGIIDLRIDVEPLAHIMEGNPVVMSKEPRAWVPISTGGIGVPEPIEKLGRKVGGHFAAAEDLIASMRDADRQPLCSAASGAMTVAMISAVMASHVRGGARVEMPLAEKENPFGQWE
ncbi:Gfo/Idh/MocA family oxidoreductase [Luteolibacter sp. SL250]|uniref:Gfo/Idh/MocA family protein n=1 Tax=Luteolibacter sp. SL250 TaxID=2995170 RepID=UPI00226F9E4D|nr:Gfo/Idh/MocA family oxidoreductase [Luteolibacter sp. SL250]WAC21727.1 Gfo/Idh/MocA family oxidoreductase [Luteolibacter sp. SL250]